MAPAQHQPRLPGQTFGTHRLPHAHPQWQGRIGVAAADAIVVDAAAGKQRHDPHRDAGPLGTQAVVGVADRMDEIAVEIAEDVRSMFRHQDAIAVEGIA